MDAEILDLHIHGAFGVDVLTAGEEQLDALARGLHAHGVGAFLPTLVPLPLPEMAAVVSRLSAWMRGRRAGDGRGAVPMGLHFEGPFVSPLRCGALRAASLLPADGRSLDAFLEAAGDPPGRTMVTLAPELPGGLDAVKRFAKRGWLVSLGHTDAEAATLDAALAAGARHLTHFANAMRPLHHRETGPVLWGLVTDGVSVDVIGDLAHVSAPMLRLVFRAKRGEDVALVSDAVPPAGMPQGRYEVWGETLTLADGTVRNGAGALAGSACLLPEAIRRLEGAGFPPGMLRRAASTVPRRILFG